MSAEDRFTRYVGRLTDAEALQLHKIVCRRAAAIYAPIHAARQKVNYDAAMSNKASWTRPAETRR